MSKKSFILCALLFCGIAEAQPVTMRPAVAPPVRVAPRPRFVRFTPLRETPASPIAGTWRAPVLAPGGGYSGPVLRAPEGASRQPQPPPRCFPMPGETGIATVTRSREVRLPTPTPIGPSAARDAFTTQHAVTAGCPGGFSCANVRTVQRTVQGAGSTQTRGTMSFCTAGAACANRNPDAARGSIVLRPAGANPTSAHNYVAVRVTPQGATATAMGRVPEHQRGTAQRLGKSLLQESTLPKDQQRNGSAALRDRQMWQKAGSGGGQSIKPSR